MVFQSTAGASRAAARRPGCLIIRAAMLPQATQRHAVSRRHIPHVWRAAIALLAVAGLASAQEEARTCGPYVPTPQVVVDAMLELAQVSAGDYVIDLGSGDGRIVLTAAQRYNARGLGVDIDQALVDASNAEARRLGVQQRVSFRREDVLETRVSDATVLTLYLMPDMMSRLQPKFLRELKPGTRIVSHDFKLGSWTPAQQISVEVPEKYGSRGKWKSTVYYWIMPGRAEGAWQVSAAPLLRDVLTLTLQQQFQTLQGKAGKSRERVAYTGGEITAQDVSFSLTGPDGILQFRGRLDGDRIRGEVVNGARRATWQAVRVSAAGAR
jgi:SAM-dependent methyltransferase